MTACHETVITPNKITAMQRLEEFLKARRCERKPVTDFEQFEKELHKIFAAAEAEVIGEELSRFDIDVPVIEIDGIIYRQVLRCEEEYFASAGPVRVKRSLYSTRQPGERTVCPMELRAGLIDGRWTPLAAQQAIFVVAHLTPQEAENMFKKLGNMAPSKSSLDRLPKVLNNVWEDNREEFEKKLRFEESVELEAKTIAISLDGVLIPMKDGNRVAKRKTSKANGKNQNGPAGYQEASCGTLSFYNAAGDLLSTIRMARMPEKNKITLKEMLEQELKHVLAQRPDLILAKLADGAKDNWKYLCKKDMPEGIEILDFYHAAEHLSAALFAAYGEGNHKAQAQFEKLRHIFRHDENGPNKVIRALVHLKKQHPRSKKIARELKYFRKNRHRINYFQIANKNLPIGSGIVEAACKTLTSRHKRSGMRWRTDGGQIILTLRSIVQSDRFDSGWQLLAANYKQDVHVPENVVALNARNHR
jgi:hypothetical protein